MTQEQKEVLLKDLSARLPYGVKGKTLGNKTCTLSFIGNDGSVTADVYHCWLSSYQFIPYLRPMSSMTEEELNALADIDRKRIIFSARHLTWNLDGEVIDYLNKKMLDWRGLIHMGLAIAVTDDDNPYKMLNND